MNRFSHILILLVLICLSGCVNRIDIPDVEESILYINLEMLTKQTEYVADFKTTNNLNGSFPIYPPQNAEIKIKELNPAEVDNNNEVFLHYDEATERYVSDSENNRKFLTHGREYELTALVEGSGFDQIRSTTIVPYPIQIDSVSLLSEEMKIDGDGTSFWYVTMGFEFIPSVNRDTRYGNLHIKGQKTVKVENPGFEPTYVFVGEEGEKYLELIDVEVGYSALTDIVHRDGFMIDFENLDNDYLQLVLKSPFPITDPNQIVKYLNTNMVSVSEDHYNYHIALHNIKKSQGDIFEENALYRSNIEKGLGLFSTCHESPKMFSVR